MFILLYYACIPSKKLQKIGILTSMYEEKMVIQTFKEWSVTYDIGILTSMYKTLA